MNSFLSNLHRSLARRSSSTSGPGWTAKARSGTASRAGAVEGRGQGEAERPHQVGLLLRRHRLGIDAPLPRELRQRDGAVESNGDPPQPLLQYLGRREQRLGVLFLLLAAEQFALVAG